MRIGCITDTIDIAYLYYHCLFITIAYLLPSPYHGLHHTVQSYVYLLVLLSGVLRRLAQR